MREHTAFVSDSQILSFMCRHLLALGVVYRPTASSSTERLACYAGTVIRIENAVYFLTAGHNLKEVKQALAGDTVIVERAILADAFGNRKFSDHPIPFDIQNTPMFFIDDDEEGLDFGLVPLEQHFVRLLERNDVVVIEEANWIHQSRVNFSGYSVLGLPQEWTSDVSQTGHADICPTMLAVKKDVEVQQSTKYPRFIGRVVLPQGLESLKGMSGGPVFGFNFEGARARYWVVAIQSSWKQSVGQIFACPLPLIASLVAQWTKETVSTGSKT